MLLLALPLLIAAAEPAPPSGEELAEVNRPVPNFRLPVYNPKEFGQPSVGTDNFVGLESKDRATKSMLVSFMASFCGPCKKEMPVLQKLHEKYKDQGLRVMLVAIDTEPEGQQKVADLLVENKVTFPVAKDRFNIVARRWLGSKSPLPSLFMVRPDGTVSSVHRGYSQDGAVLLEQEVASSLGLPPPAPPAPEPVAAPEPPGPAPKPAVPAKGKATPRGQK
jgi:thiol-disulfide isomerase/thioredoxin